jgi:hypothetical protein
MGERPSGLLIISFAIAILASPLCMTPARAQQAPAPPDLGPAYFAKEKDPSDPKGKKERSTKTIRPAKCSECQGARDALQEAVENWYQFQADEAQKAIDKENEKKKPDSKAIDKFTKIKADAQQGAKQHPNAPKKRKIWRPKSPSERRRSTTVRRRHAPRKERRKLTPKASTTFQSSQRPRRK